MEHPLARGLEIDSPSCSERRREIIQSNTFLKQIYEDWYGLHAREIDHAAARQGKILEIGSGGGFFKEYLDREEVVTSDIIPLKDVDLALDARHLEAEFAPGSLRAITMVNVLHHIPRTEQFLESAQRTLAPGGVISMIEPWVTPWAKLIYKNLHHEDFDPKREKWDFISSGPLSGSNGALPWIMFERDREKLETLFPQFRISQITPMMPFRYLVSGGVSMVQAQPGWIYGCWRSLENALQPCRRQLAMFAHITLSKHL